MRVAVVGAGAIGGWVAARLALAGNDVMALTSRGALDRIVLEQDREQATAAMSAFSGAADLLIVAVKAPALAGALSKATTLIGTDTTILPMLNGVPWWFVDGAPLRSVDPDGRIASTLPQHQVVGCVVHASCGRGDDGCILVNHVDRIILGEPGGGHGERVAALCGRFTDAGIPCETSDDVRSAIWYKLWGNATINPLSALTRATADLILADRECREWMLAGMAELAAIGGAVGCPISENGEDRMAVTARLGAFKTSMLQDVEAGRPIELEALLGAPIEIARRHGIATPSLDRLYAVTKLLADAL